MKGTPLYFHLIHNFLKNNNKKQIIKGIRKYTRCIIKGYDSDIESIEKSQRPRQQKYGSK